MFILITANWERNEKKKHDNEWGIVSNLNKYLSNKNVWAKY